MKTQTINLIALRSFLHGYNVLSVGDALVTTPGHAKQLVQLGHARPGAVPEPMVSVAAALGGASSSEPATPARALLTDSVITGADGAAPGPGDPADATVSADGSLAVAAEPNSETAAAADAGSGSSNDAEDATGDKPQSAPGEPAAGSGDLLSGAGASSGGTESPEGAAEEGADVEAKAATRQRRRTS